MEQDAAKEEAPGEEKSDAIWHYIFGLNRKFSVKYLINAIPRVRTDDWQRAAKILKQKDADKWHSVMWTEIQAFQQHD